MPMLQEDSYLKRNSKITENRAKRPFIMGEKEKCPFCKGKERQLEEIYLEVHLPEERERIRIVKNKYPFCEPIKGNYGFHDVVIDTLSHKKEPKDFSSAHWVLLLEVMQKRWYQLQKDAQVKFTQIFKNNGSGAGASIIHSHWQIAAFDTLPLKQKEQNIALMHYYEEEKQCYICEQLHDKVHELIIENSEWQAVAPAVSQYTHETWLILKTHKSQYGQLNLKELQGAGELLKKLLNAYNELLPKVPYNICFMSNAMNEEPYLHFYIQLIPRLVPMGGFEVATGCYINTVHPKTHATALRQLVETRR
ncbi:galactose-1-phosphate uridylyltransferase [Sporanaerobium hydrogeniformans]|uniref:galactose-1-phosphate uridylyltransferase n=1 Tax=Sporanaerobium hydrogeniformans TaxID=3072179 RepID=UPI0015D4FBC3|nr:DUF4931 domain-containing protein [Sporanaerobium hydrogeniformans]